MEKEDYKPESKPEIMLLEILFKIRDSKIYILFSIFAK